MSNDKGERHGGDVNYYLLDIKKPKRLAPYKAECEDIIEALGMSFAEGCAFKAIWRSCAARTLGKLKAGNDPQGVYDAQKVVYYGQRMVAQREQAIHALQVAQSIKGAGESIQPYPEGAIAGPINGSNNFKWEEIKENPHGLLAGWTPVMFYEDGQFVELRETEEDPIYFAARHKGIWRSYNGDQLHDYKPTVFRKIEL